VGMWLRGESDQKNSRRKTKSGHGLWCGSRGDSFRGHFGRDVKSCHQKQKKQKPNRRDYPDDRKHALG